MQNSLLIILVQGFCPLKIKIILNFLADSVLTRRLHIPRGSFLIAGGWCEFKVNIYNMI